MRRKRPVRKRAVKGAAEWPAAAEFARKKRRVHPFSAVKPFLAILALLFVALYALIASGVRLSSLAITLYAVFMLLFLFGVALAYLSHARDSAEEDLDYLPERRSTAREFAERSAR